MSRPVCHTHPGRILPCGICTPEARRLQEAPMENVATLPQQQTLSDEMFPPVKARDVPMVKVAISGTIELTRSEEQQPDRGYNADTGEIHDEPTDAELDELFGPDLEEGGDE